MFLKLWKHDWRASSRLLGLLSLGAIGVALLGGFALWGANGVVSNAPSDEMVALTSPGLYLLFSFCCMALVGYVVAVQIIQIAHFYKSRFTDQGYLTFTLPVKTKYIYLSSAANMLLWLLLSLLVALGCFTLLFAIGMGDTIRQLQSDEMFLYFWDTLRFGFADLQENLRDMPGHKLNVTLTILRILLSPIYTVATILGCVTLGSVWAKRHKILAAIGVYYLLSMAISIATGVAEGVFFIVMMTEENLYAYYNLQQTFVLLLNCGITVGSYLLSVRLMKKKLNLN